MESKSNSKMKVVTLSDSRRRRLLESLQKQFGGAVACPLNAKKHNKSIENGMKNTVVENKEISIFRTSVVDTGDIQKIEYLLNTIVGKRNWNFDLEDKDNILRINASLSVNSFLAQELRKSGFECTELW